MNSDDYRDESASIYIAADVVIAVIIGSIGAVAAVVLAVLFSGVAHAEPRFEALGGQCRYGAVGNYVWFNEHYPHQLDMTSGCGLLGISKVSRNAGDMHIGWRIAYVDMGTARTNAVFPMLDAEQVSLLPDGSKCNSGTWNGCVGRGVGEQTARGISAGYVAEFDVWHAALGLELGAFVYEGMWRVTVTPEAPSHFQSYSIEWRGYQATPFLGASLRYGYLMGIVRGYARIRAAEHGCGGCSGVAGKEAWQALVGLSVPF